MSLTETKAFVCGWPIHHSRSPMIHGHWLSRYGISGSYEKIAVSPDDLSGFLGSLAEKGFAGGNVTLPHKETAFRLAAKRDEAAEAIGAVNTVWLEDGQLCGSNTDAYGFAANMDAQAQGWDSAAAQTAIVLGAGGAARAIIHALASRGISRILIANRTIKKAEALAESMPGPLQALPLDQVHSILPETSILVNTTSVGMSGEGSFEFRTSDMPPRSVVSDIVYVPLKTKLLADAEAAGHRIVDGLGMLIHQAVPGFEKWFGLRPEVTPQLRNLLIDDLAKKSGS